MSNLINPLLLGDYVDDVAEKSVQGVYVGSMDAPQEDMLDKKLEAEHRARAALAHKKADTLERLNEKVALIVRVKKMRNVKDETIAKYRREALELKEELERLEKIKI